MSERDELVVRLRDIEQACRHDPFSIGLNTALHSLAQRATDLLERDGAELDRLTRENEWLRAYTGQSAKACVYCGLGADEQGQCERGFPGCARADDLLLCREVGVAMERDAVRAEVERLRQLCAAAYQMAGVVGAPVRFLDALSRHDDVTQEQIDALLPVFPHEFDAGFRDTSVPIPPGECPYPIHADRSIEACVAAGDCGCGENKT